MNFPFKKPSTISFKTLQRKREQSGTPRPYICCVCNKEGGMTERTEHAGQYARVHPGCRK